MPRITYVRMDIALGMLGCMPPRRAGESNESFGKRKSNAATQMEIDFSLTAYAIPGKRARRYRLSEVTEAQKRITPIPAAA